MAQSRGRSGSRRKGSKSASGGSLLPWIAMLVVVGGGIGLYENSRDVRRFVAGLTAPKPTQQTAVKSSSPSDKPVPPRPIAQRQVPLKPSTPPDQSHTAAIIPPAPIGKPGLDVASKPAAPAATDAKLAGSYQAKFFLCGTAKQDDCVVSADRFVFHGQKIRLVGIEVPDMKKPRCEEERIKGSDAELRVRAFLDSGPFELVTWQGNDSEVDGHKLREVTRNGMSLSDILVREGLARRAGAGGKNWC